MKIDVEKLIAALTELGLEKGQIDELIAKSSDETQEDSEGKSEEENTSSEDQVTEEKPSESEENEGENEVVPSQEDVPAEPESVPPLPEEPLPEEVPVEEVPVEEPPVETPVEEVPVEESPVAEPELPPQFVSIEEFAEVKNELAEQKKANEGLINRISSLEQALKDAGVIDGSIDSSVGVDDPSAPGATNVDTTLDDVLRDINRKGY